MNVLPMDLEIWDYKTVILNVHWVTMGVEGNGWLIVWISSNRTDSEKKIRAETFQEGIQAFKEEIIRTSH